MDKSDTFSCFIIGTGSLPIQCGQHLVDQGQYIRGIISPDSQAQHWAAAQNIPYFESSANLTEVLGQQPFDYLFSIINLRILGREHLELPRKLAINFHDGPLPMYAGMHATSWALLNHEPEHGITWHVITEGVDTGDILLQRFLPVSAQETAFTLNLKCYEAAIESFKDLVHSLSVGTVRRQPQDLTKRTYFRRSKRLNPGGLLSLNQPARDIDALARALDFGPVPNPLGTCKLSIGRDVYILSEIKVLETRSRVPAGTLTAIREDFLQLATADFDIAVHRIANLNGEPVVVAQLIARHHLQEGYVFEDLPPDRTAQLQAIEDMTFPQEAFWLKRLETLEPLPFPYVGTPGTLESAHSREIAMPLSESVQAFLAKYRGEVGELQFLFAGLVAFLARISGIRQFDIGFQSAELRTLTHGFESYFSPIVPLRLNIDDSSDILTLVSALRGSIESLAKFRTFAHDLIARNPSLAFVARGGSFSLPVVVCLADEAETRARAKGSQLTIYLSLDGTKCQWVYDPAVLDSATVGKAINDLKIFLEAAVTQPEHPISQLPLLDSAARRLLLEWNATFAEFPRDLCLHHLFEMQAARTPNQVAVLFGDQQLTYRELNERANQVAHHLIQQKIAPDMLVGIAVERSLDMLVGVLGILKAGGAYVPLDPEYPPARLKFMLEDTQASVVLTQSSLRAMVPQINGAVICLDTDWHLIARHPVKNPQTAVSPNNLAYVIYTSGSTGIPKGVMTPHSAIVNLLFAEALFMGLAAEDRMLAISALSFDSSVRELMQPIIHGAGVVIADNEARYDGQRLAALLSSSGATRMDATPSTLRLLLETGWNGNPQLQVNAGGEEMEPDLAVALLERLGQLWNPYGPTETTVECTSYRVQSVSKRIPIGKPIANTTIYVLDANMQALPIGVPGELYIGGSGVARGYLNRPALTSEKFVPNPFDVNPDKASCTPPAAILYRTGDLVRFLPDGNLEFLGRIDSQVKLRGFRIELGEIEAALRAQPGVTEAVVLRRQDHRGDARLVGYVTTLAAEPIDAHRLRQALVKILPKFMVPATIVVLDQFPFTSSGKLDRRALPMPDPYSSVPFRAPRTRTEATLAAIWAETLHLDKVGVDDPFLELGGHSLHAVQIISRVREAFSIPMPLRTLFDAPTVAQLARIIEAVNTESIGSLSAPPLVALPRVRQGVSSTGPIAQVDSEPE